MKLTIHANGNITLRSTLGDFTTLLRDAATGHARHKSRHLENEIQVMSLQLAEWYQLWHHNASEVYIGDDVRRLFERRELDSAI